VHWHYSGRPRRGRHQVLRPVHAKLARGHIRRPGEAGTMNVRARSLGHAAHAPIVAADPPVLLTRLGLSEPIDPASSPMRSQPGTQSSSTIVLGSRRAATVSFSAFSGRDNEGGPRPIAGKGMGGAPAVGDRHPRGDAFVPLQANGRPHNANVRSEQWGEKGHSCEPTRALRTSKHQQH
jgi:hypothetical protein